jgi:hypothetical protein
VAVAAAAAGLGVVAPSSTEPASSKAPRPLLGIVGEWSDARLVRVDSRSLRPLRGPRLDIFDPVGAWAFSPDGSRLALATACQQGVSAGRLQLVDVRRMRPLGCFAAGYVAGVAWPTPNRLLVVASPPLEVLLIDPAAHRVISRTQVEGARAGGAPTTARAADRLVALTGRLGGPQRIIVADARGSVRSVGVEVPRASEVVVEPTARHAYIVWAGSFASVDLDTLTVTYVRRSSHQAGPGRISREIRRALWMGRGVIASFGSDAVRNRRRWREAPVGLRLIRTRTGSVRMVDEKVSFASLVGGILLATGADEIGLVAYDSRGRKRFQLFRRRPLALVNTFGGKAYVQLAGKAALQVVDVHTGRLLAARRAPLPLLLLKR